MNDLSNLRMPGAILMTRLRVYDTVTPDGQIGGTPHVHLMCNEMYVVQSGSGAVEILDMNGFRIVELQTNSALLFTPGTIHRLINPQRNLEILAIMQNSGLPERGDNVVTFPMETLADDARYSEAMRVTSVADAYRRRDAGVEGFVQLKAAFEESLEAGQAAIKQFYRLASERTVSKRQQWATIVREGAQAEVEKTFEQLQALRNGELGYLEQAQHHAINLPTTETPGFCGHLNRYFDPATLSLEGILEKASK